MRKRSSHQATALSLLTAVLQAALVLMIAATHSNGADDKYREARAKMVAQDVAGEGITNRLVLNAINTVKRHEFVPSKLFREAYIDKALAIGYSHRPLSLPT